jgi:hypothetical protein
MNCSSGLQNTYVLVRNVTLLLLLLYYHYFGVSVGRPMAGRIVRHKRKLSLLLYAVVIFSFGLS